MRNARKRRLKRKHGNTPARRRPWAMIKTRPAPPIALAPRQRPLSLDEL